jgi:hypothetical protein
MEHDLEPQNTIEGRGKLLRALENNGRPCMGMKNY